MSRAWEAPLNSPSASSISANSHATIVSCERDEMTKEKMEFANNAALPENR